MWRSSFGLLKQLTVNSKARLINNPNKCLIIRPNYTNFFCTESISKPKQDYSNSNESANTTVTFTDARKAKQTGNQGVYGNESGDCVITALEARKLMRLVDIEALKMKLGTEGKEVISYKDLLEACQGYGVAKTNEEAAVFARVLDDAGVVLLFRDKVYLHPDKVYSFSGFRVFCLCD